MNYKKCECLIYIPSTKTQIFDSGKWVKGGENCDGSTEKKQRVENIMKLWGKGESEVRNHPKTETDERPLNNEREKKNWNCWYNGDLKHKSTVFHIKFVRWVLYNKRIYYII